MPYTVCNRGRPIGETDLGFARYDSFARAGWFHPNAYGEQVMPIITSVHVALHAWSRRRRAAEREARQPPDGKRSIEGADLAEALQHSESLELTLHRDDGSLVPTELIGLRDTEQVLAWAREDDDPLGDPPEAERWLDDLEPDPDLAAAIEHDFQILMESEESGDGEPWEPDESCEPWAPDDDERVQWPRYQIIVRLAEADAIP